MEPSILFFGKKDDYFCNLAVEFIKNNFSDSVICLGSRNQDFPQKAYEWKGDYIISYLSPWIIPAKLLKIARKTSINFHPGPTEYPGIGCTNFAIYNREKSFGITCHHMQPKVDTGDIIVEKRFLLFQTDTVLSLTQRCYAFILTIFYDVMQLLLMNKSLPKPDIQWKRKPFTRKELNELCRLTLDMTEDEINRRIKAVTFPNAPGAYFAIGSKTYKIGE